MTIEINITPDDIDALVKQSIMKSGFGTAIEKAVQEAMKTNSYNSPVTAAINGYVGRVCLELIETKYAESVRAAVSATIERMVTKELIDETVEKTVKKMVDASRGY